MNKKLILKYCDSFAYSEHDGLIITANTTSGMNFKMTKECFDIIDNYISMGINIDEFLKNIMDDEDRIYIEKLLGILVKYEILVDINKIKSKISVSLEITERCNLKCKHCCIDAKPSCENTDLSTESWKQIIDKIGEINLNILIFTGGEPMIRDDFFELAEYAKHSLNVPFQLMTNGMFINEKNADRLLGLFDDFSFSLDGSDEESCSAVRGKGVFDKVIKNIELMKRKGMKNFSISMTEVKQNKHCVDDFNKLAEELGATPIIRNFDIIGRGKEHLDLIPDDIDACYRPFLSPFPDGYDYYPPNDMPMCISCGALRNKFAVSYNGTIYPCISMLHSVFSMDNILEIDSIRSYFESGKYKNTDGYKYFMEMHPVFSSKCDECPVKLFCESCVQYSYLMKNNSKFEEFCADKRRDLMAIWK